MHRFIMQPKKGERVCRVDENGLNNRRQNLFIFRKKPYRFSPGVYAIPLTKGKIALVDDVDLSKVEQFHWCAHKIKKQWYAFGNVNGKNIHMHRFLMDPRGRYRVDHHDGDGLNNRRKNLRVCTPSQNSGNMARHSDSTSPYKGVTYNKRRCLWAAQLTVNRIRVHFSLHESSVDAAYAYDGAAKKHFGRFARINFQVEK
jgi:hypothetical protein